MPTQDCLLSTHPNYDDGHDEPLCGPDFANRLICPGCPDPTSIIEGPGDDDSVCGTCGLALVHETVISGFRAISTMCGRLSLDELVRVTAKRLYNRCHKEKVFKGTLSPMAGIAAACIFVACRQAEVSRTFAEVSKIASVKIKVLAKCFRTVQDAFNDLKLPVYISRPENFVAHYCDRLELPPYAEEYCKHIIQTGLELGIGDRRSPVTIASSAVLFTCKLLGAEKSTMEVKDVVGPSERVTLEVYELYVSEKWKLVKSEWLESGRANMGRL